MRNLPSSQIFNTMEDLFRDLNRFAIGFEPMLSRIHNLNPNVGNGYPPYNLDSDGNTYRLELAVAGFKLDELDITLTNDRVLIVRGSKPSNIERNYIHRGIAARDFERQFTLAEQIKVVSAKLEDGLLVIELERESPQENSRKIPIASGKVVDIDLAESVD